MKQRVTDQISLSDITMKNPKRFVNREFSWLQFNTRVLMEAANPRHPLLERLQFLSISAANLDEFFMVRVAGLAAQIRDKVTMCSADGRTAQEQLDFVLAETSHLQACQLRELRVLRHELKQNDIEIICPDGLLEIEKSWLEKYFLDIIYPVLKPLSIDSAYSFPFVPNLGLSFALQLSRYTDQHTRVVLLPVPTTLRRFILLPQEGNHFRFIACEDVMGLFIKHVFPDDKVDGIGTFRVIRDSDIEVEEEAEDLVHFFETALKKRRRGQVIRIEFDAKMPKKLRQFITNGLSVPDNCISVLDGFLALNMVSEIVSIPRDDLKFIPYVPRFPEWLREHDGDCFAAIRKNDIVIHHPYESFDVVVQFLRQAARDPDVVEIKQTLYRTSNDSPIVSALIEAAEQGKSVTALVELKARFDEEANIRWARDLERAGVRVFFGFIALKTHAKMSLIIRREGKRLCSYVHLGTGNYHPVNAKVYTDLSFFTTDDDIGHDVGLLFNYIAQYKRPNEPMKIVFSPLTLRSRILKHIEEEITNAKQGRFAAIWMKVNALVDPEIIDALYRASQAGVQIDLVVRGICCLRPHVPRISDNIRAKSIVGRFLEHSRIFCFGNGEDLPNENALVYLGSADMMPRNLDHRIEILVPVLDKTVRKQILLQIMLANIIDNQQSFDILSDGTSRRITPQRGESLFNAQEYFMAKAGLSGWEKSFESSASRLVALHRQRAEVDKD
ncbi:polyphosphate kinase [Bartonella vinsonii subsp. arupensis Pm136co]|uniref:Polyphosphate kinase n=1 Tax=Bartonella vinsonii subsp. arupensis Pm136co TaxID=1094561 RepID=A0ABN0GPE7_BARVI|nr:RNA degradosome polyphosphate kinase [Bartonella vinsonii]EJF97662.1 polyphosphate kinase [Bartonella vinsonii subsp. arupensis Pm136co]